MRVKAGNSFEKLVFTYADVVLRSVYLALFNKLGGGGGGHASLPSAIFNRRI